MERTQNERDDEDIPTFTLGAGAPETPFVPQLNRTMSRINESNEVTPLTNASQSPLSNSGELGRLVFSPEVAPRTPTEESKYEDPAEEACEAPSTANSAQSGGADFTRSVSPVQLDSTRGFISTIGRLFVTPRAGEESEHEDGEEDKDAGVFAAWLACFSCLLACWLSMFDGRSSDGHAL